MPASGAARLGWTDGVWEALALDVSLTGLLP
jgi:hypothetical protein